MVREKNLPPDAAVIAQRWHEAKARNPRLTQDEFVRRAIPSYKVNPIVTKGKNKGAAKTAAQIADSRARYLRLVLEGKRSGTSLVRQSNYTSPGGVANQYQARVYINDDIGWKSINVVAEGNRSTLDVFRVENNPKMREVIKAEISAWASKYHRDTRDAEADLARWQSGDDAPGIVGQIEVRKVRTQKTRPIYLSGSE